LTDVKTTLKIKNKFRALNETCKPVNLEKIMGNWFPVFLLEPLHFPVLIFFFAVVPEIETAGKKPGCCKSYPK
jgi:hypothetical protein